MKIKKTTIFITLDGDLWIEYKKLTEKTKK